MAYTAYDWQQTLAEKADYAESRLHHGQPVVAVSYPKGLLLLTFRKNQQKIFEIYDRLVLGALGSPSDLEAVRQFAVDFTHAEGYQRSAEDVSIQRVVSFAISPVFKRAFSDPRRMPIVLKSLFAQMGSTPEEDVFFTVGYDGEFHRHSGAACVGGTSQAEERALDTLQKPPHNQKVALERALHAWAAGCWKPEGKGNDKASPTPAQVEATLKEHLEDGFRVEAAVLERDTPRERKFTRLVAQDLAPFLPETDTA